MQWFKHDSNSTMDYKIKKLIIRYGAVGYAVYFHCLELITESVSDTNINFQLEHDAEIIADDLRIKGTTEESGRDYVEKIMRFMVELGLFEESNGHIFCFKLLKRLDLSMTSNKNLRQLISNAKENYKNQNFLENHDEVMTNHDTVMLEKKRKDKIRQEQKRKEDTRQEEPSYIPEVTSATCNDVLKEIHNLIIHHNNHQISNKTKIAITGNFDVFKMNEARNFTELFKQVKNPYDVTGALKNYLMVADNPNTYISSFSITAFCKNFMKYTSEFFDVTNFLINAEKKGFDKSALDNKDFFAGVENA